MSLTTLVHVHRNCFITHLGLEEISWLPTVKMHDGSLMHRLQSFGQTWMKVLAEKGSGESSSFSYLQAGQQSQKSYASFIGSIIFSLDFGLHSVGMRANGDELVFDINKLTGVSRLYSSD